MSGDSPKIVAARNEVLKQLDSVPEPYRETWRKRLKSKDDPPHFSVCLEIYLHQFFRERGWGIEIEPELPGTPNRPDFVVRKGDDKEGIIVEAKTVLGPNAERRQDDRLMKLADDLGGKLNCTVTIHPYYDLPSSLPNRHIAAEIEKKASGVELLHEFRIAGEHNGYPYVLGVTVILEEKPDPTADVVSTLGQVVDVDIGNSVRKAIRDKAGKYGNIQVPFAIAVWPKLSTHFPFPSDDDLVALYGDEKWIISSCSNGVSHKPNGVFTTKSEDGTHRYSHVSAVLICYPDVADDSLRVYHNPFADRPLGIDIFKGFPQCTGKGQWVL